MKNQDNITGIYYIENTINNKVYIGSSHDIFYRIKAHVSKLNKDAHNNKHLQSAFNKYGISSFKFRIVEKCEVEQLIEREQHHIDKHDWNLLYNKAKIAYEGGSNVVSNAVYLLDLEGNIINKYDSGNKLCKFLQQKILDYKMINTNKISKRRYRIVTPNFYETNMSTILSWKPYSNESLHQKQLREINKELTNN